MPRSAITDSEYDLKIYERNVQVKFHDFCKIAQLVNKTHASESPN